MEGAAMHAVGIRELKEQVSEVIRRVREDGETIAVTYRGQVVAQISPLAEPDERRAATVAALAQIDRLAAEVGARWPKGVSAVEAVRDVRREL
jgi:prevent-host-death family protein